jgi:hypothetical protein
VLARYRDIATAGVKGKEGDEREATKELYSTLHKAIGDRYGAMAARELLRAFTHDVKSASEFSEELRVPEKAVILAKSFFNEIREWLQGERVIPCIVVSFSWDVGFIGVAPAIPWLSGSEIDGLLQPPASPACRQLPRRHLQAIRERRVRYFSSTVNCRCRLDGALVCHGVPITQHSVLMPAR